MAKLCLNPSTRPDPYPNGRQPMQQWPQNF